MNGKDNSMKELIGILLSFTSSILAMGGLVIIILFAFK